MSKLRRFFLCSTLFSVFAFSVNAQESVDDYIAKGKELYFEQVSCWVCHGDNAEGRIGPSIANGPTPTEIQGQLDSNPQMAIIVSEMNPNEDDLVALSAYLTSLNAPAPSQETINFWRNDLTQYQMAQEAMDGDAEYVITERDRKVIEIQDFDTVLEDWQRKSKVGSQKRTYDTKVLATYEAGEQVFFPEAGKVYFYENTGPSARRGGFTIKDRSSTNQVVVGDATAKEVIASKLIPQELDGVMHTTVLTSDARYVYIVGPPVASPDAAAESAMGMGGMGGGGAGRGTASLLKVDALTLNPVKQVTVGGRIHHGQLFDDEHILFDTFVTDPDGLNVFLYNTTKDEVVSGVRCSDLGGSCYTSYTDGEFVYILMQPPPVPGAGGGATDVITGAFTALRPYWVAKVDPKTWSVVQEYPYRGYRGDWIVIDSKSEFIYIPTANSTVNKINTKSGDIVWSTPAGMGPYAATLNADETELWVTNKGESSGQIGRTLTVIDAETGRGLETLFSGISCDHVLLSPNGKEMWVTSNGEGRIYVFDAETREQIKVFDMPHNGDAHGLVWAAYDEDGNGKVVRDQGGFHNGINPAEGKPL